ncbi:MAG: site-specific integrase, partial [Pseudonocardiales bacterium]|nr:site-specific integrase [Pseudonocardiales bacterium]
MGSTRRKAGLLGSQVEDYWAWLIQRGYTPGTVRNMLKDLGHVGVWLSGAGFEASQFNEERVSAFLAARRAAGHRR